MSRPKLVLASTSIYRRALLERLRLPFETTRPEVDESPLPDEGGAATALRLAQDKARAPAGRYQDALIIGSDQVAILEGQALGKPGTHDRAVAQLRTMRGKTVLFHTGLAVHATESGKTLARLVSTAVSFRDYSDATIEAYLAAEPAYDCAGSAKAEALGIALIARMDGDDPNALIGLPLIALVDLLTEHGFSVL